MPLLNLLYICILMAAALLQHDVIMHDEDLMCCTDHRTGAPDGLPGRASACSGAGEAEAA